MIFSYFSMKTYVVTPHQNRLDETVVMMRHKNVFMENHPCYPFLSGALIPGLLDDDDDERL